MPRTYWNALYVQRMIAFLGGTNSTTFGVCGLYVLQLIATSAHASAHWEVIVIFIDYGYLAQAIWKYSHFLLSHGSPGGVRCMYSLLWGSYRMEYASWLTLTDQFSFEGISREGISSNPLKGLVRGYGRSQGNPSTFHNLWFSTYIYIYMYIMTPFGYGNS